MLLTPNSGEMPCVTLDMIVKESSPTCKIGNRPARMLDIVNKVGLGSRTRGSEGHTDGGKMMPYEPMFRGLPSPLASIDMRSPMISSRDSPRQNNLRNASHE